ncbi:hypothetical protein [Chryseobacterium defluvii]|nr:hypothetical protein [Chryseobacterium defluvii]
MKTDQELVNILIDVLKLRLYHGMCGCATSLFLDDHITYEEHQRMRKIIRSIAPPTYHNSGFYWHYNDFEIRIQKLSELQFNSNGKLLCYENR